LDLAELRGVSEISRRSLDARTCRSCERRQEDFGGCRCQAFLLTGDASATDPVCELAPLHHLIEDAVREHATAGPVPAAREASFHALQENTAGFWSYRTDPK